MLPPSNIKGDIQEEEELISPSTPWHQPLDYGTRPIGDNVSPASGSGVPYLGQHVLETNGGVWGEASAVPDALPWVPPSRVSH